MEVFGLSGKSGTGKSYKAMDLCRDRKISTLIDDGLLIRDNRLLAGESAKKQPTKIGAVKTALFFDDRHRDEVAEKIKEDPPDRILVIGTSDRMIDKIVDRLGIPRPKEYIDIEDITTESERKLAHKQRYQLGKHVIPLPTFQLKKQFSGYFMDPLRFFRDFGRGLIGAEPDRSVVRPAYSYLGEYQISDKVISDIAGFVAMDIKEVRSVSRVVTEKTDDGISVRINTVMKSCCNVISGAERLQKECIEMIEIMTAFNVERLDVNVKGVK